ncbi:MAG: hypothetical protein K0U16_07225 [Gammaproteobacteria bacterium]|nr:hypothetical protein [Gammaproteobacteria bacterium]
MRVAVHLCMPEGDAMRARFGELMELVKRDNRTVIAAMLANGDEVPDTVGEWGLLYDPEQHRTDEHGEPVLDIFGVRQMVRRGRFSCGCAAALEAAILEEKYGVPTLCVAVSQGEIDLHGVFVTCDSVVDPVANYLSGRKAKVPTPQVPVDGSACIIGDDGRVVCFEEDVCAVDENGVWDCRAVPGLTGRRASIGRIHRTSNGQAWARTRGGAVVPVRRHP